MNLLEMSAAELDTAFAGGSAGVLPAGTARGTMIVLPGTAAARPLAQAIGAVAWRGKVFHGDAMDNLVTPFGVRAVRARVYRAASWVDDRECVVLDYAGTSTVAGWIRDEIREIEPSRYLGVAWGVGRLFGGRRRILRFALDFAA